MRLISALIAGVLFGLGMIISGMANPAKILNFLDVAGDWDPSLAFVLGGAIAVGIPGFWLVGRRLVPFFSDVFHWPGKTDLELRLVVGGIIFGIGWGLSGFCPGPAISGMPLFASDTLIFIAALLCGMWAARLYLENPFQRKWRD